MMSVSHREAPPRGQRIIEQCCHDLVFGNDSQLVSPKRLGTQRLRRVSNCCHFVVARYTRLSAPTGKSVHNTHKTQVVTKNDIKLDFFKIHRIFVRYSVHSVACCCPLCTLQCSVGADRQAHARVNTRWHAALAGHPRHVRVRDAAVHFKTKTTGYTCHQPTCNHMSM